MLALIAVLLFCVNLVIFLSLGYPLIYALLLGYVIFMSYGLLEGHSMIELLQMSWRGFCSVRSMILVFALIGIVAAFWRASGTISYIIYYGAKCIRPSIFFLLIFLLCSLLSSLIGSSFATVATMGVISISLARVLGANELIAGGAILSGIYVGDRCSPMSTSALLVAEITKTNFYDNIRRMLKTGWGPFLLSCLLYYVLGRGSAANGSLELLEIFPDHFNLSSWCLLPAAIILVMSCFRCHVRWTLLLSITAAFVLSYFAQGESLWSLAKYAVHGFQSPDPQIQGLLAGGGMLSMWSVSCIVAISASYAGIFEETNILKDIRSYVKKLSDKTTPFTSILTCSLLSTAVSCNQTLAIILTDQLCRGIAKKHMRALALENSAVLVSALIPWSIAVVVPLDTLRVGMGAVLFAFFLYLIPAWNLVESFQRKRKRKRDLA